MTYIAVEVDERELERRDEAREFEAERFRYEIELRDILDEMTAVPRDVIDSKPIGELARLTKRRP